MGPGMPDQCRHYPVRYRLGEASRLCREPGKVRQNARGNRIDLLQNHLFFGGLYFRHDEMLDALLDDEGEDSDQHDGITA